jgi:hypothetical protein
MRWPEPTLNCADDLQAPPVFRAISVKQKTIGVQRQAKAVPRFVPKANAMKTTLDLLITSNRDLDLTPTRENDKPRVAAPTDGEPGCRCDRWGHPCPGCAKLTVESLPTRTASGD